MAGIDGSGPPKGDAGLLLPQGSHQYASPVHNLALLWEFGLKFLNLEEQILVLCLRTGTGE